MRLALLNVMAFMASAEMTVAEIKEAYKTGCCHKVGDCIVHLDNTPYLGTHVKRTFQSHDECNQDPAAISSFTPCEDGICLDDIPSYPHTVMLKHPFKTDAAPSDTFVSDGNVTPTILGPISNSELHPVLGDDGKTFTVLMKEGTSTLGPYLEGLTGDLTYESFHNWETPPTPCVEGFEGTKTSYFKFNVDPSTMLTIKGSGLPAMPAIQAITAVLGNVYMFAAVDVVDGSTVRCTMKMVLQSCAA